MKVCSCVKNSIWYDPRVRKQIAEYMRNGIDVVGVGCVCPRYSAEELDKIECPVFIAELSQSYFQTGISIFKKIFREIKSNYLMYRFIKKCDPDIIHANDLNALIPAYFAAKRRKAKLIYDSHEIFIENPWIARKKWLHKFLYYIEKYLIKRVHLLVTVSNAANNYMQKLYGINSGIVVTNCISRNTLDKIMHYPKSQSFEVLNHGQFYEGRGYDILIRTAPLLSELTDVKMVLRGFGPLEGKLRDMADSINSKNVIFAPPVKMQELISFASQSKVGIAITEKICLNFQLSVSNKIFEYAAAGLPVIMSDIPEHRYLNDKYKFGIVLLEDTPEELASAIRTLYLNHALYNELAKNAKILSKELTWELEFRKLINKQLMLIQQ